MIKKICPICGQEFTAKNNNIRYCSSKCAAEGARLARKAWERRTGYKEAQRERMRAYRAGQSIEKAAQKAAEERRQRKERAKRLKQLAAERQQRLQERAAAGEPHARMMLSNRLQTEYWQAFKDYELQLAEAAGEPSRRTVNGISIYTDQFETEVIRSIKERNIIITELK